jgi:hypothetical protein
LQVLFSVAVGFFAWDLYVCIAENWGPLYIVHAIACGFVFLGGIHPFLMHMGSVCLLFEASTVFLHLRRMAIDLKWSKYSPSIVSDLSMAFGLVFFVTRIVVGLTASYFWWFGMLSRIGDGTAHSIPIYCTYLACNALLCALNVYWFVGIVGQGLRAAKAKADGNATSEEAAAAADEKSM